VTVFGVEKFERFFRAAAGLDVDKEDLRRHSEFVHRKLYDLLLIAQATAEANSRDIIQAWDLPITKGLQESIHAFRKMDEKIELKPIMERLTAFPPLNFALSSETEARLPHVIGGLSLALARTFKAIDPTVKNPQTEAWERANRVFDLLL
jgi:hypothetical protein